MVTVSDRWKQVHMDYLVPLSDVQIEYHVTDPEVQDDLTPSATPEASFSSAANMVEELREEEIKYAMLEQNIWLLDKSYTAFPNVVPAADGFVSSNLSDADGTFSMIPTITLSFSQVHPNTIPGISFIWSKAYDEFATRFQVTAYNGSTVVATRLVEDNRDVNSQVWMDLAGYDKIVIEILTWCLPYRRARLLECLLGIKQVYTKVDLFGFSHEQTVDLLSATLPKNSIVFQLDNVDERWNPDNPEGAEKYLLQKQMLKVKYGFLIDGAMEWIRGGTFYMSEWNTPANGLTASFTARDMLEFCGDVYTGPRSGTLLAIAQSALEQSGVGLEDVILDSSLAAVTTDFTADEGEYSCAEVLQMCANAAKCCMWQCRDGILHIEPLDTTLTDYVIGTLENGMSNSYAHPEFTLTKELKSVDVNSGMGTAVNSATGTIQTASNPLIVDATVATAVAEWCRDCLKNRKILSGSFRADPRLDALDKVTVVSKYSSSPVYVTSIKYEYNGAFKGTYEGRVVE